MKKKPYTRCRPVLSVILLSSHILSSCVNTRQTLGMRLCRLKETINEESLRARHIKKACGCDEQGARCAYSRKCRNKKIYCGIGGLAGVGIMGLIIAGASGKLSSSDSTSSASNLMENTTIDIANRLSNNSSITTPLISKGFTTSMLNISSEEANRIMNAIHTSNWNITNPKVFDMDGSTLPTQEVKSETEKHKVLPNLSNTKSGHIKEFFAIEPPPLHLIKDAMSNIEDHNFLIENIRHWLDLGLSIDARDEDGATLLIKAAEFNKLEAVKFLISKGANVNAQDKGGDSALAYALHGGIQAEPIIDYLVTHGADPCIKNIDDILHKSDKRLFRNVKFLEALKKCF